MEIKRISRRDYLRALLAQPSEWIQQSMQMPSADMKKRPVLIALHGVALRRMSRSALPVCKPYQAMSKAEQAAFDARQGITSGDRQRVEAKLKRRDVPQSVFDSPAARRIAKIAIREATEELNRTPRHLLDEGNPNHPQYDMLFGYDREAFMRKQYERPQS